MSDLPERYIKLFLTDGTSIAVMAEDEPTIDAAVTRYIESGETADRLLELTALWGSVFKVTVSAVQSWLDSTPETRRAENDWRASAKHESPNRWQEED